MTGNPTPHPLLRSVTESGAVLLAIAAGGCSGLLTLADAAITIPCPDRGGAPTTATWPAWPSTSWCR